MSYLSRIRLNPLRTKGREFLRNPRTVHAAVMGGLPEQPNTNRVLWRLDTREHNVNLLVLTPTRPDWTHIVEQAGWPHADGDHVLVRDYTPVLGHLASGREFAFRLTANPVQSTMTPDRLTDSQRQRHGDTRPRRGFRVGHRTAAHQIDWLLRRTDKWGFTIPTSRTDTAAPGMPSTIEGPAQHEVRIVNTTRYTIPKKGMPKPVTMHAITFEGRLTITDPDKLRTAMLTGIGPTKAYGCGLLTLAPLRDHPA
ncbi:type I-E CRISPR-associated protein Cas6/Cse3/CasE [Lentzea sp. NBRC 105346]|uniref:type I-E CRISPR-associated protein Cas6/Cse3/CasE n=1 Tax=Lentzea sp. NBRC 105346 TaxID=3032205 RepID=UPI0024A296A1|nr:type I-E CRISPR-associated protein Cas6/Cse3/CasE [Lentzea sp. NBRC 105346]GLZ28141.1 type I-E CRISPR-associated protein Cas6/Cse3/CasE [Lentzea sp. NBRC 105346]